VVAPREALEGCHIPPFPSLPATTSLTSSQSAVTANKDFTSHGTEAFHRSLIYWLDLSGCRQDDAVVLPYYLHSDLYLASSSVNMNCVTRTYLLSDIRPRPLNTRHLPEHAKRPLGSSVSPDNASIHPATALPSAHSCYDMPQQAHTCSD
jgi:hypothetical protein